MFNMKQETGKGTDKFKTFFTFRPVTAITMLLIKRIFEKNKSSRAVSEHWMQFWPRITPGSQYNYGYADCKEGELFYII